MSILMNELSHGVEDDVNYANVGYVNMSDDGRPLDQAIAPFGHALNTDGTDGSPPPMAVDNPIDNPQLAKAKEMLKRLNRSYPLCRFEFIVGVVKKMQDGTFDEANEKAFICENHAPINSKHKGLFLLSMAKKHAQDMVNAEKKRKTAIVKPPNDGNDDNDNDSDDDSDDDSSDDDDSSEINKADAEDALCCGDRAHITKWLNQAAVKEKRLANLQRQRKMRSFSTAVHYQAFLQLVITTPRVGGALCSFVHNVFYRASTSDARTELLRRNAATCRHYPPVEWMRCGKVFADFVVNREVLHSEWEKANCVKEARKLMIDALFFVLRTVATSAGLSPLLSRAAMRQEDRLRNLLREALPEEELSAFFGHVRVAAMVALPLDLTYAVFARERHWYSERHYRMLQAACSLGFVDVQVRTLVGTLESGLGALESTAHGKERAPNKEQMLAEIEATMMAQVDDIKLVGGQSKDMMNKRYEAIVALLPDLEDHLTPFTTPLFWWPVAEEGAERAPVSTLRLHYIDMTSPEFQLQLCETLDMKRAVV